jgi:hypothetical protein
MISPTDLFHPSPAPHFRGTEYSNQNTDEEDFFKKRSQNICPWCHLKKNIASSRITSPAQNTTTKPNILNGLEMLSVVNTHPHIFRSFP